MKFQGDNRRGFTLLEMLVVIGLTAIVMGLIFGPLFESLGFTHRTQTMVSAQDNARLALSQISKDLSDAIYVYDNTHDPINFPMEPKNVGNSKNVTPSAWISSKGVPPQAYYAKIDMVLPRMKGYCSSNSHPSTESREYDRGEEAAPTCPKDGSRLELRPVQPSTPDTHIVRYFIGLADPGATTYAATDPTGKAQTLYVNPYAPFYNDSATANNRTVSSNMYVLYRVEFNPSDPTLIPQNHKDGTPRSLSEKLNDPNFFYNTDSNGSTYVDSQGNTVGEPYWHAWKKICRAIVTIGDTDLVKVTYADDANHTPIVTPTVTFAPTAVSNDPLVPTSQASDDPEHSAPAGASENAPPVSYRATYGHWVLPYEVTLTQKNGTTYKTAVSTASDSTSGDMCIYRSDGTQIFDIDRYLSSAAQSSYGAGTIYSGGDTALLSQPELAFTVDAAKGLVNCAFPHVNKTVSTNLSSVLNGYSAASFSVATSDINTFYANWKAVSPESAHRLWEIHDPADWAIPSTYSTGLSATATTISKDQMLGNSTVVPGMERVIGPNCNPGQSFGKPVQYSRVPFWNLNTEPGLNQYKIDVNYGQMPRADGSTAGAGAGALYFMSNQTYSGGTDVHLPTATDYTGLGLTGTIDQIYVLYYEQNNQVGDSLRANYVTKSLLTVTFGMQIYDSTDGKPQSLQLTNKIRLRNIAS